MSNTNISYQDLQKIIKKDCDTKIKDIAIQTLQDILGWREIDLPEGNRASRAIEYIEDRAHEALKKISRLNSCSRKTSKINNIEYFDKKLEQNIASLKENYFNHILYINCKKELENAGFTILEPEKDYKYPKVFKEY